MKAGKTVVILVVLVALFGVCPVWAVDITFSTSGTIEEGDIYDDVYVENDSTVVDMFGGQITKALWMQDSSIFNMFGGDITAYGIDSCGASYFNISNGTIDVDELILYGAGGSFLGGNISVSVRLKTGSSSMVQIEGGILNFDLFDIYGNMDIKGGSLTVHDILFHDSTMNIYGDGFCYDSTQKLLTGYLMDGNYFSMGG